MRGDSSFLSSALLPSLSLSCSSRLHFYKNITLWRLLLVHLSHTHTQYVYISQCECARITHTNTHGHICTQIDSLLLSHSKSKRKRASYILPLVLYPFIHSTSLPYLFTHLCTRKGHEEEEGGSCSGETFERLCDTCILRV